MNIIGSTSMIQYYEQIRDIRSIRTTLATRNFWKGIADSGEETFREEVDKVQRKCDAKTHSAPASPLTVLNACSTQRLVKPLSQ